MTPTSPLRRAGHSALYRQAADVLRADIVSGQLRVGDSLPAEAELAKRFGVSLITVRQALRDLQDDGLIRKRPAKPAMVIAAEPITGLSVNTLNDLIAAAPGSTLDIFDYAPRISAQAARSFALATDTPIPCLHARRLLNAEPLSELTIYFPPAIGLHLSRADFDNVLVFRTVERRLGLKLAGARVTLSAELADTALARVLDVVRGAAVLTSTMLYRGQDGCPVELTIARHRADRFRLSYELPAG